MRLREAEAMGCELQNIPRPSATPLKGGDGNIPQPLATPLEAGDGDYLVRPDKGTTRA